MNYQTISIIIPVYNVEGFLRQCMDSILAQTYRNLEIICLNDGSTDDSLAILREYERRDARVNVIDKANEGYGATCNRGIEEANGFWITIVEPDDWILPDMYAKMIGFAATFPHEDEIDIVKTPYWRVIEPDTPQQQVINCSYHRRVKPPKQPFVVKDAPDLLIHHPSIWSALYRKDFLNQHGIRFLPIPGAGWADNPFLVESFCQARSIVYLDEPFYCYREETEEKTRQTAENNTLLPLDRWQDMTDILERLGVNEPAILNAHYRRGFTYLNGIVGYVPLTRDDVLEAAIKMFDRMDPSIVFKNPYISPEEKRIFAMVRDIPAPRDLGIRHALTWVGQGIYFLRNAGPAYSLEMTRRVLRRMRHSRLEGNWRP